MDAIHSCHSTGCYPKKSPVGAEGSVVDNKIAVAKEKTLDVDVEAPPKQAPVEEQKSAAELSYKRSEKTSLFIKTQDGDVVRIRIKARESAAAEVSVTDSGESKLTELDLKARESVRIGVFVKGDLDAGELEAIQSVVDQAGALANDFFSGDTSAAFAAASGLEIDGQELARVALRLKVREQFNYAQSGPILPLPEVPAPAEEESSGTGAVTGQTDDAAAEDNSAAPAVASGVVRIATSTSARLFARIEADDLPASSPVADDSQSPAESNPTPPVADDSVPAAASDGADDVAADVADSSDAAEPDASADDSVENPATTIGNSFDMLGNVFGFLSNLIEALNPAGSNDSDGGDEGQQPSTGASESSVSVSLRFRIFGSIVASLSETTTAPVEESPDDNEAALALLGDAVDTLAAESEPPFEAVA